MRSLVYRLFLLLHVPTMVAMAVLTCPHDVKAQSYKKSQDLGPVKYKSWDDVPSPRSSSTSSALSLIYDPNPDPSLLSSSTNHSSQDIAPLLRRRRPEVQELQSLFEEILAEPSADLIKKAGVQLELPDHERWFADQFGAERGTALSEEYKGVRRYLTLEFSKLITQLHSTGQTKVAAYLARSGSDAEANAAQKTAFQVMQRPAGLYSLRIYKPGALAGGLQMYSFVYVDGAFRFVGKMQSINTEGAVQEASGRSATRPQ